MSERHPMMPPAVCLIRPSPTGPRAYSTAVPPSYRSPSCEKTKPMPRHRSDIRRPRLSGSSTVRRPHCSLRLDHRPRTAAVLRRLTVSCWRMWTHRWLARLEQRQVPRVIARRTAGAPRAPRRQHPEDLLLAPLLPPSVTSIGLGMIRTDGGSQAGEQDPGAAMSPIPRLLGHVRSQQLSVVSRRRARAARWPGAHPLYRSTNSTCCTDTAAPRIRVARERARRQITCPRDFSASDMTVGSS